MRQRTLESKFDKLSDGALFKLLKSFQKELDVEWIYIFDHEVLSYQFQRKMEPIMRKYLGEVNENDVGFFQELMELNKESLFKSDKLDFELDRPVLSKYMVNVEHRCRQYYIEMSHQDWMCYTERQALNIDNYNGFNAFDGKYDVPYYGDIEEDEWTIDTVDEMVNESKK